MVGNNTVIVVVNIKVVIMIELNNNVYLRVVLQPALLLLAEAKQATAFCHW